MFDFKHANVISLIGVVYERKDLPLVVLPYMENGDLCSFIRQTNVVYYENCHASRFQNTCTS